MPVVDLIPSQQVWACQFCTVRLRTERAGANTPMHACSGKAGFRLPMLAEGQRGTVRTVEREDYVGGDSVQVDGDGRPIMRVERETDEVTDVWVYAPTAQVSGR